MNSISLLLFCYQIDDRSFIYFNMNFVYKWNILHIFQNVTKYTMNLPGKENEYLITFQMSLSVHELLWQILQNKAFLCSFSKGYVYKHQLVLMGRLFNVVHKISTSFKLYFWVVYSTPKSLSWSSFSCLNTV